MSTDSLAKGEATDEAQAAQARRIKSSSEILNELFGTFDTSFDETEVDNNPSSPVTSFRQKGKHSKSKKKKHVEESPKKKKKSKRERSKSRDRCIREKSNHKVTSDKVKIRHSSKPQTSLPKPVSQLDAPLPPENDVKDENKTNSLPASKYPSIQFRGQTIVLDIEEGEITEAAERKAERKKHLRKREGEEAEKRKRKKLHSVVSSESEERNFSTVSNHKAFGSYKKSKRNDSGTDDDLEPHYNSSHNSSRRRSESSYHRSRSRSRSPADKGIDRRDKRSYEACRWERARERSPDKPYHYNGVRRTSAYDYDWQKYNGTGGGFGYSGQNTSRGEDDYYDYRRDRERRRGRSRSRSGSPGRRRSRSRSPTRRRSRSRSSDRYPTRSRSNSYRERSTLRRLHPDDIIDKSVLLDIARKNAAKLMRSGVLPTDIFSRDQILAIKAGGKSVEELTEYCKRVAKRDTLGDANDSSDDDHAIHHPFTVKDRPMPGITMNIRNSIPLQIRTPHELAIENAKLKIVFPVSSGTQHRYKELEWKPVDKDEEEKEKKEKKKKEDLSKALLPIGTVVPLVQEEPQAPEKSSGMEITLEPKPSTSIDIGAIISKRLRAVKDLEENPDNAEAKERFENASKEMKQWAEAKALEPKFLTPAELLTGPQAWVKKDQLKTATALQGGMGMHLLQRMGWSPGEGLGKNKEGSTEPLALDIKMDKKGLASTAEGKGPSLPSVFDLTGKHPVSSLMELCAKRRWGDPIFELCFEHGPSHKPQFVYKVTVNGVEYQPCIATKAKKEAKHHAAAFCLQSLGLLPIPKTTTAPAKPAELLKTVCGPTASPTVPASPSSIAAVKKADTKLMPPPPPPPALQKLLDFPLPPQLTETVPKPTRVVSGANTVPLPVTAAAPRPLMDQSIEIPSNTYSTFSQRPPKTAAGGMLGSRLMSLAGMPAGAQINQANVDPYHHQLQSTAPIVQVPLPSSSIQGFPGLTTF